MNKKNKILLSAVMGCFLFISSFYFVWAADSIVFSNPIGSPDLNSFLALVAGNLSGLVASLAVIFIVVGGIMYMISAGDQNMIERAKKIITAAIIGLVIALSAQTFLVEIYRMVGGTQVQGRTFQQIAIDVLKFLLGLVGVLGIIAMVIGGVMMLTAYGNEEQVTKGKKIVTYAIIGVIVSLGSLIIVQEVTQFVVGG